MFTETYHLHNSLFNKWGIVLLGCLESNAHGCSCMFEWDDVLMSGRLLREVDPELMDGLIQATKDGDHDKFQDLSGSETLIIEDGDDEAAETEDEYEEQV